MIHIRDLTFKTKKELGSWCRKMIATGQERPYTYDEHIKLLALLERHPRAEQKIGVGVRRFFTRKIFQYYCLHLERFDGSSTDFSYLKCVKGSPTSILSIWRDAARMGIRDQILDFRAQAFSVHPVRCEISGVRLRQADSHVDHVFPDTFIVLSNRFLEEYDLTPSFEWLSKPEDNQYRHYITNARILRLWQEFHRREAKLRMLHWSMNLGRESRTTDPDSVLAEIKEEVRGR